VVDLAVCGFPFSASDGFQFGCFLSHLVLHLQFFVRIHGFKRLLGHFFLVGQNLFAITG
jgi:hypothetical protein